MLKDLATNGKALRVFTETDSVDGVLDEHSPIPIQALDRLKQFWLFRGEKRLRL